MAVKRGQVPAERFDPPGRTPSRSWGARVSKGIALADYSSWLDERALFIGQWGLKGARGSEEPPYEDLVEAEASRPAE